MKYLKSTNEELTELYANANQSYYHDGEPIISDVDFDELQDEMIGRGLDTTKLRKGNYGEEIKHKTICPSLKKVNVKGTFNKGHHSDIIKNISNSPTFRKGTTYNLHYKLDGLAINAMYDNGVLANCATRGDYFVGRNVTNKVKHLIPKYVDKELTEVRYECIIPIKTFEKKYINEYSHPRNLASGILNDEDMLDERKNDLVLIPLNGVFGTKFINGSMVENMKFPELAPHTFDYETLVDFEKFKCIFEKMKEQRPVSEFPTDGLVLSPITAMVNDTDGVKYPNHSVSIKFPPKGSKATVKSVTWNLKKSGEFVPIINLEPVKIDNRKIVKTHGFNHGFVTTNGIEKGAIVEIEIAGDIIPYLSSVVRPSDKEHTLPEGARIEGCHLYSDDADAIKVEKFIYGALKFELKDFGEAFYRSVASYFEYNPFNIFNTISFTVISNLTELGITEKTSKKFLDRVKNKKEISLKEIIVGLSIDNCGDGTSTEVAKFLAKEVYGFDSEKFEIEYDFARKQKDVVESCTKGKDLETIKETVEYVRGFGLDVKIAEPKKIDSGEIVLYVMTGSPKASTEFDTKGAFKKTLPENYVETKSMAKCNLLITDDLQSNTSKMKQAHKRGIDIRTYKSFEESDTFDFFN